MSLRRDAIGILRGLKKYEVHHGVRITDSALVAAATLSDRYITSRFLPDKAIDLVDKAASRLRMKSTRPVEIDEVERIVRRLEVEELALQRKPMRHPRNGWKSCGKNCRPEGEAERAVSPLAG